MESKAENIIEEDVNTIGSYESLIHDMKTLLTISYSNLQSFEDQADMSPELKIMIMTQKKNWYKMMKLINNYYDFGKINSGVVIPKFRNYNVVDVTKTMTESVKTLADKKNISLKYKTNVKEKIMATDKLMLERILLNLLSNAVKYTNKNGKIVVSFLDKKKYIKLSVEDNGIGISSDKLDMVFERYISGNEGAANKGFGIGLSITKELANLLNGKIYVESGKTGTNISIELPCFKLEINPDEKRFLEDFYSDNMVQIELSDVTI